MDEYDDSVGTSSLLFESEMNDECIEEVIETDEYEDLLDCLQKWDQIPQGSHKQGTTMLENVLPVIVAHHRQFVKENY